MDEILNKLKDKKFLLNILIYLMIFLAVIFFMNWLVKSNQSERNKNLEENFNAYYRELLALCDKDEKIYKCCFDSVLYMAAGNLKTTGLGCEPGFKPNTFSCPGSYKWCEMIR